MGSDMAKAERNATKMHQIPEGDYRCPGCQKYLMAETANCNFPQPFDYVTFHNNKPTILIIMLV
jgi:hypothetical protein